MDKIDFKHGGEDYDSRYPDGIPTSMLIQDDRNAGDFNSDLIMYPSGHAQEHHRRPAVDSGDQVPSHGRTRTRESGSGHRPNERTADPRRECVEAGLWDFKIKDVGGFS